MEGIQVSLCAGILILIGLDSKISWSRWKTFGIEVELNPLVKYFLKTEGLLAGLAFLLLYNLGLLALLHPFTTPLAILFGAKLSLAILQIKSLEYK